MDNNGIPRLFIPTCHCLFMHSPLCAADVPWSFGSLLFWIVTFLFVFSPPMTHPPTCWRIRQEWSWRWLLASCILPWCPFLDAFCTLSIYPSMFFSPICQHLFEVTDLTTRGCSFFGNSNRPTLFICYQGSIEKLTLLGAIYYHYYQEMRLFIEGLRVTSPEIMANKISNSVSKDDYKKYWKHTK
jgi:hypothetical protein